MEESVPGLEASKADLVGYGYDPNHLAEGRDLTRDDLDPHFPDQPVMLLHVSLHGAVLNTALYKILEANPPRTFGRYHNHLKIAGVKIVADGSPQGKTASFTKPYLTGGPGRERNWRGEPSFPQDQLNEMFKKVYENNLRRLVHANGDAAIDVVLAAHVFASGGNPSAERRTTVVRSQFVRPDQLDKYVSYKLIPSFYTEHTFFFSDAHPKNRGKDQIKVEPSKIKDIQVVETLKEGRSVYRRSDSP